MVEKTSRDSSLQRKHVSAKGCEKGHDDGSIEETQTLSEAARFWFCGPHLVADTLGRIASLANENLDDQAVCVCVRGANGEVRVRDFRTSLTDECVRNIPIQGKRPAHIPDKESYV